MIHLLAVVTHALCDTRNNPIMLRGIHVSSLIWKECREPLSQLCCAVFSSFSKDIAFIGDEDSFRTPVAIPIAAVQPNI